MTGHRQSHTGASCFDQLAPVQQLTALRGLEGLCTYRQWPNAHATTACRVAAAALTVLQT